MLRNAICDVCLISVCGVMVLCCDVQHLALSCSPLTCCALYYDYSNVIASGTRLGPVWAASRIGMWLWDCYPACVALHCSRLH